MPDQIGDLEGVIRQSTIITRNRRSSSSTQSAGESKLQVTADQAAGGEEASALNAAQAGQIVIPSMSSEQSQQLVDTLNEILGIFDVEARYYFDSRADRQVVQLRDKSTDELIRQVPSEEFLSLVAKTRDFIGLIFDQKA